MIDSGASDHVVRDISMFETVNTIPNIHVILANGARMTAAVKVTVNIDLNETPILLTNVHYIQTLKLT